MKSTEPSADDLRLSFLLASLSFVIAVLGAITLALIMTDGTLKNLTFTPFFILPVLVAPLPITSLVRWKRYERE